MTEIVPYNAINVLLEVTERCNLRCAYCFHANSGYAANIMSEEVFRLICELVFPQHSHIQMLWHGGEPLAVERPYIEKLLNIQKDYIERYGNKVINTIQTNGTLIDEDVVNMLFENDFSVGISFDGPTNEVTRGRTQDVLHGLKILKERDVKHVGVITVVSGVNVNSLLDSYELMKEMGVHVDYNSIVLTGGASADSALRLDLNDFNESMINLFDAWFDDESCSITVNPFYSYVHDIVLDSSSKCWHTSCLGRWINIKPSGDVFPCSREFPAEYSYGNVKVVSTMDELLSSKSFQSLLGDTVSRREKCMRKCRLYKHCQGGCTCNALTESGITEIGGFHCLAYQTLFSHAESRVANAMRSGAHDGYGGTNPQVADLLNRRLVPNDS